MSLEVNWRKLYGYVFCTTQVVKNHFVLWSMYSISRKENLVSTFFLGMFATVTLSSTLPVLFICLLKDQQ